MISRLSSFRASSRWGAPLACALSLLAASCGGTEGGGASDASSAKHKLVGQTAPELGAESVTGSGPTSIKDAKGKVLIVDFWGTFCGPCKKSFPKYQDLVDQFGGDLAVVGVSVDEPDNVKKDDLVKFAKDNHAKFAIVWDKDHSAAQKYDLASLTMPSCFVVDKTGTVRHVHKGFKDGEETALADEVKELLK
jgi:cytochrome c biogenesis protein CcmG, thiol:disulfide interchange protein DsbE